MDVSVPRIEKAPRRTKTDLFDRLRPCPNRLPPELAGTDPNATACGGSTRAQAGSDDLGLPLRAPAPVRRVLTRAGAVVPSLARRACSPNSLVVGVVVSGKVGRRGEGGRSETSERKEALARRSAGKTAPDRRFESDSDDDDLRRGVGEGAGCCCEGDDEEEEEEEAVAGVGGGLGGMADLDGAGGCESSGAGRGASCRMRMLCGPAAESTPGDLAPPAPACCCCCCCCCWALGWSGLLERANVGLLGGGGTAALAFFQNLKPGVGGGVGDEPVGVEGEPSSSGDGRRLKAMLAGGQDGCEGSKEAGRRA
jgi:hypothetical protein